MRAYYATQLSQNISRMPNGFLVCKNVPIARTGTQDYQGSELGIAERPDDMFPVQREESDVFDPAAIASFEGVPLVDEHPANDVTVDNAAYLMRGFIKDVRRGEGKDADKMMADIIATDPIVIAEIENGKREISCGYKCDYETDADGRISQRNIRGNHVALVYKGRAGQDVAIKDSEPKPAADHEPPAQPESERRAMFMKTQSKDKQNGGGFLAKLFGVVTADADPAVVAEIAEHLLTTPGEGGPAVDEGATKPEAAPAATPKADAATAPAPAPSGDTPPAWAQALIADVAALKASMTKPEVDPLDALEKEIAAVGEEKVTKPVEQMDSGEATLDTGDTADTADGGEATDTGEAAGETPAAADAPAAPAPAPSVAADAKYAIATAKKAVAGIKDAAVRRSVSDSMAGMIRQMYGVKPSTPTNSYANILAAKQNKAKQTADAYPAFDSMETRQAAYDSRNPHIKRR